MSCYSIITSYYLLRDVFHFNYTKQSYKLVVCRCFYTVGIVHPTSQIYNSHGVIFCLIFQTDNHWSGVLYPSTQMYCSRTGILYLRSQTWNPRAGISYLRTQKEDPRPGIIGIRARLYDSCMQILRWGGPQGYKLKWNVILHTRDDWNNKQLVLLHKGNENDYLQLGLQSAVTTQMFVYGWWRGSWCG